VRPLGVAGGGEGVELGLQFGEGRGGGLGAEPFLQGLLEPLDFALGLGVAGPAVFLGDAQAAELVFQAVAAGAAADEPGGADGPVVSESRRGRAVSCDGSAESGEGDLAGGHRAGGDRQREPGVVIQPGHDLDLGAAGQVPVDEIGLPPLVGLLGREPDVRRLRPLARLGGDQPGAGQVPADRRRRHLDLMVVFQVPGNGVRARVQALPGQLLPQPGDQLHRAAADRRRRGLRAPRPRLERCLALSPVTRYQRIDPRPGHPVRTGHLAHRALLDNDSSDHKPGFRHDRRLRPGCPVCHETRRCQTGRQLQAGRPG
jgi:hypothetical protein